MPPWTSQASESPTMMVSCAAAPQTRSAVAKMDAAGLISGSSPETIIRSPKMLDASHAAYQDIRLSGGTPLLDSVWSCFNGDKNGDHR